MVETRPETPLATVRVVLVEPAGALNVGAIARVMKNMGLTQLVVVNPHCAVTGEEARRMAVHADDVLAQVRVVSSLPAALAGCQRAIATTGRDDYTDPSRLESPRQALPWLLGTPSALIFGPEDRGLSNAELDYAQRWVQIPASDRYTSLNLAQAAAICCYELYQAAIAAPHTPTPPSDNLAPLDTLERYYQGVEDLLLHIGYLYPHTAPSRMAKLRRLLQRAYPSSQELAMLQGMIRQLRWALSDPPPKQSPKQSQPKKSD
jgi:tRNA/rRNA methyltransferase